MSIMLDLPPSMAREAREYATVQGTTLEQMLVYCLVAELERRRKHDETAAKLMEKWRELVRKGRGRMTKPYVLSRADAYPEGEFA